MMTMDRELFGGAITASLPTGFVDISHVRDVPDNQECFAEQETDRSVIVEILEMEQEQSNESAPEYFFTDLADANGSVENQVEFKEFNVGKENMPALATCDGAHVSVLIGTQSIAKFNEVHKNQVRIFLCNLRLPKYETDILITMNAPVRLDPQSSSAKAVQSNGYTLEQKDSGMEDLEIFKKFIGTFRIVNPGLFGG